MILSSKTSICTGSTNSFLGGDVQVALETSEKANAQKTSQNLQPKNAIPN